MTRLDQAILATGFPYDLQEKPDEVLGLCPDRSRWRCRGPQEAGPGTRTQRG